LSCCNVVCISSMISIISVGASTDVSFVLMIWISFIFTGLTATLSITYHHSITHNMLGGSAILITQPRFLYPFTYRILSTTLSIYTVIFSSLWSPFTNLNFIASSNSSYRAYLWQEKASTRVLANQSYSTIAMMMIPWSERWIGTDQIVITYGEFLSSSECILN